MRRLRGCFDRGSFRNGVRVPRVSEKGKGVGRVGGGVGTGKGIGKSMRTRLSKLPFRFSLTVVGKGRHS